jgi:hypothetical protein
MLVYAIWLACFVAAMLVMISIVSVTKGWDGTPRRRASDYHRRSTDPPAQS